MYAAVGWGGGTQKELLGGCQNCHPLTDNLVILYIIYM